MTAPRVKAEIAAGSWTSASRPPRARLVAATSSCWASDEPLPATQILAAKVATGALPMWPTAGSDRRLLRQRILGAPDIDGADQESWERLDPLLQPPAPGSAVINATLPGVMPWSAELPQLYRLHVSLVSPAGETVNSTDIPSGSDEWRSAARTCWSTAGASTSAV